MKFSSRKQYNGFIETIVVLFFGLQTPIGSQREATTLAMKNEKYKNCFWRLLRRDLNVPNEWFWRMFQY